MAGKKKKTKTPQDEILSESKDTAEEENSAVIPDSSETIRLQNEAIAILNAKIASQEDEISRLLLDNQSLSSKLNALTMRVGGLLKEKEQLTVSINELLKR